MDRGTRGAEGISRSMNFPGMTGYHVRMVSTPELVAACLGEAGVASLLVGGLALGPRLREAGLRRGLPDGDRSSCSFRKAGYSPAPAGENFRRYLPPTVYHAPVDFLLVDGATFDRMLKDSHPWQSGVAALGSPHGRT